MNIAIDVYYSGDSAKCVGVLFDWEDERAQQTIITTVSPIEEYEPGNFYKRELPCILKVLEQVELNSIEAIIVDGYVYTDNNHTAGLGQHLWLAISRQVNVIGVAKSRYHANEQTCQPILRGSSKVPLFVSAAGIETAIAAKLVQQMKGNNRMPDILAELDRKTKESD